MLAEKKIRTGKIIKIKRIKYDKRKSSGSVYKLKYLPVNTRIFNIEGIPEHGGKYARSAGVYARILKHYLTNKGQRLVHLELPSDQSFYVSGECAATVGYAGNGNHKFKKTLKAGKSIWFGRKPNVRGVAMNPVDHPHGGGEGKTSGGRPSVSPWGYSTKGFKTLSKKKRKNKKIFIKRFNKGKL